MEKLIYKNLKKKNSINKLKHNKILIEIEAFEIKLFKKDINNKNLQNILILSEI